MMPFLCRIGCHKERVIVSASRFRYLVCDRCFWVLAGRNCAPVDSNISTKL
jgi:hypothetical protein